MLPPAEKSSGGVWLPERSQDNWTHGVVIAAGPGELIGDRRTVMWLAPGDEALFPRHAFHSLGDPHTHGWVRDEDVVAYVRGGEVFPANDWVMIGQDPDEPDPSAAIAYAEEWRPKALHGVILAYGPGAITRSRWLEGARKPVPWLMHWEASPLMDRWAQPELTGQRVWWSRECEVISMGREHLEALFIAADDLLFIEED